MRHAAVVIFLCFFLLATATPQSPKIEVPQLPTEVNQFGGRPGTFHFVTNEQTMANATELQKAFASLDALEREVSRISPAVRTRLQPQVEQLRAFALAVHAQNGTSAGETAAEVEERLNAAKGEFMCGACHGHGMMHGRMGHGGGPRP